MKRWVRNAAAILALAGVYFVSGKAGLKWASVNASATAVWPPSGLSLAALLLFGYRLWPGVWLGAFLANFATNGGWLPSGAIACGNTLEAVTGAWMANRLAGGKGAFDHAQTIFKFILFPSVLSTTISATCGVATLCFTGLAFWREYHLIWQTWWIGDVVSDVIVAPLFLIWATRPGKESPARRAEALLLSLVILLVGQFVFGTWLPETKSYPLEYLAVPPLVWIALRFYQHGASAAAFLISALALWGTLHGYGPFAGHPQNESLLLLQTFMGTITVTALVLAAVASERKRAEQAEELLRGQLEKHAGSLERTVADRTARLRETVGELEAFSYSISHDLRAPLRAMQNYAAILQSDEAPRLSGEGKSYLDRIITAANRLDRLIQDVLKYSRVGRLDTPLAVVDLEKLLREIIEQYHGFREPRAEIEVRPPLLAVVANEAALTQCISNILGNAVKFVVPGVAPRIRIWSEAENSHIRLNIADNGIGIAPNHLEKIFRIFERVHSDQTYEGTGIGLAIAKKAIERMGGEIGVTSELGRGSTFWIQLPKPLPQKDGRLA